jgi:tetratricopeptide (TPR) repeat protein
MSGLVADEVIYEVGDGGTEIDLSQPVVTVHLDHKAAGNTLFSEKDFAGAVLEYSKAIDACPDGQSDFKSIVFSNRAASHGALSDFDAAATDAAAAVLLDKGNVKAHYRLASYNLALKNLDKALQAASDGLKVESKNAALLKLRLTIKKALKEVKEASAAKAPASGKYTPLYDEKTAKHGTAREMIRQLKAELSSGQASKTHSSLDGMFARLMDPKKFQATIFPGLDKDARNNAPKTLLELLNNPVYEEEMAARGIPDARTKAASVLENVKAKGAKENQFMDAATEANLWPQIMQEAIAHQVVDVVNRVHKRNHAERGISMAVVCAVACAKDLNAVHGDYIAIDPKMTAMVDQFNAKYCNLLSPKDDDKSPDGEEFIDQLPPQSMIGLQIVPQTSPSRLAQLDVYRDSDGLTVDSGWFVLDDFLGEDAFSVIKQSVKADCRRMVKQNRMNDVPVLKRAGDKTDGGILAGGLGKVAWVADNELQKDYASVHEVIKSMKLLPRELNKLGFELYKHGVDRGNEELGEAEFEQNELMVFKVATTEHQTTAAVALTSLNKGDKQDPRIDSGEGPGGDVGHAVSCIYFIGDVNGEGGGGESSGRSGAVRLTNSGDGRTALVEVKPDRLVVFRSKDVENERLEVLGANESQFAVHMWVTGCITNKERIEESLANLSSKQSVDAVQRAVASMT